MHTGILPATEGEKSNAVIRCHILLLRLIICGVLLGKGDDARENGKRENRRDVDEDED